MRIEQQRDSLARLIINRLGQQTFDFHAVLALPFRNLRLSKRVILQPGVVIRERLYRCETWVR